MSIKTDVLIIGCGVAGLYAALNLNENLKITLICKTMPEECNTFLAQGGIATALDKEDIDIFVEDTMKAGRYKNNKEVVRILARESRENIINLERLGVNFDKHNGKFDYTREGAHRVNRIVHYKDRTGQRVFEILLKQVKKCCNIELISECCLIDILSDKNSVTGAIVLKNKQTININAKSIILATGGVGAIFNNTTNQKVITGDGIAIALKNKIKVEHLDYVQIHPTGLYEKNISGRRVLISESMRGEGGKLKNINGQRFIDELLPRDIVANAILKEEMKTNNPYVYLDISELKKDYIINRFPSIYEQCLERGVDITRGLIPVTPVQHYLMGGIKVDKYCRTTMKNLFACGETSCTGVHGANRLASNSLLEALVFSKRAANYINKYIDRCCINEFYNKNMNNNGAHEEIKLNRDILYNEYSKILEGKNYELASNR